MNLTIGNGKLKTWQTLKTQYIAAAAGLALAAGAITGISSLDTGTTASAPAPVQGATSISVPQRSPSDHTIFILGSEQQARDWSASVLQDLDLSAYGNYSFVADPDGAYSALIASDEIARQEAGATVRVVDMRGAATSAPVAPALPARVANPVRFSPSGPGQVTFYLVSDHAAAAQAQALEEHAQWVRYDNNVPEPSRSVITLVAGTSEQDAHARNLIDDAMAAGNFSDSNPAPSFQVVDLR